MNKALGVSELSHLEHLYLEALAEAYQNATSWDTRRQVLLIMAGAGTFNNISHGYSLSACASIRNSLQGLDYFAAEGARAFDDLVALVRQIGELVLFYQQVHVTSPSNVADHCVLFALSDCSDSDYQQQCSHQHTNLCDRCQSLQETLAKIERVLGETTFPTQDAKDEALFIFQTAQLAIMSWKCHILRSANQYQARIDALEKLDDNTSRKKQETEVEQDHDHTDNTNESSSVFTCPQDGCVKVFQRLSSLEKHLSLEKCTKSPETVFDRPCQTRLQVQVGGVHDQSSYFVCVF
ncbi:unnamed protein product [Pocillopora meandrina]|uniref:C2H2-type domain-containing protein n=1 Tax=Pocillopora meandrina TaxID=46732 RepID=A0AAU9Y078_9CNID|nr:unnamed protein product [Pocillopora meandrina]